MSLNLAAVLDASERINAMWSGWVQHFATLLGMSFRERLELPPAGFEVATMRI
jgi:hypothetical protein